MYCVHRISGPTACTTNGKTCSTRCAVVLTTLAVQYSIQASRANNREAKHARHRADSTLKRRSKRRTVLRNLIIVLVVDINRIRIRIRI